MARTDRMATEEGDGRNERSWRGTDRTVEQRDQLRGHGRVSSRRIGIGGGQESMLYVDIIDYVGDLNLDGFSGEWCIK